MFKFKVVQLIWKIWFLFLTNWYSQFEQRWLLYHTLANYWSGYQQTACLSLGHRPFCKEKHSQWLTLPQRSGRRVWPHCPLPVTQYQVLTWKESFRAEKRVHPVLVTASWWRDEERGTERYWEKRLHRRAFLLLRLSVGSLRKNKPSFPKHTSLFPSSSSKTLQLRRQENCGDLDCTPNWAVTRSHTGHNKHLSFPISRTGTVIFVTSAHSFATGRFTIVLKIWSERAQLLPPFPLKQPGLTVQRTRGMMAPTNCRSCTLILPHLSLTNVCGSGIIHF